MKNKVKKTSIFQFILIIVAIIVLGIIVTFGIRFLFKTIFGKNNCTGNSLTKEEAISYLNNKYVYNNFEFIEESNDINYEYYDGEIIKHGFLFKDSKSGVNFYVYNHQIKTDALQCKKYSTGDNLIEIILNKYLLKYNTSLTHNKGDDIIISQNRFSSFEEMVSVTYGLRDYLLKNNIPYEYSKYITFNIILNDCDGIIYITGDTFNSKKELIERINEKKNDTTSCN